MNHRLLSAGFGNYHNALAIYDKAAGKAAVVEGCGGWRPMVDPFAAAYVKIQRLLYVLRAEFLQILLGAPFPINDWGYRQSFTRFQHDIENDLVLGLYRHVAVIIFSCLVDVDQDGWLKEFLLGLSEEQRGSWANQMEFVLRDYPSDRKQVIWDRWLKDYWQGRLHGKPCILTENEAGELLECALSLEPVFPAAVDMVLQGPPVKNRIGTILYHLEQEPSNLIQLHPNAVLRLLKWLFHNCREDWYPSDEVEKVIMLLPKKKAFVPDLVSICDQLAKFGFAKSIELKAKIQKHFIED